jgi:hypothetical protein
MTLNSREVRGKAIADQGDQIKKVNDHSFEVKSQSGNGFYEVKETKAGMTCDCPISSIAAESASISRPRDTT